MYILDLHLGYEECDICGNGNNHITAQTRDGIYLYHRSSRCYGDVDFEFTTAEELGQQIKADWFLVATRHSRNELKAFMKRLIGGEFDAAVETREDFPAVAPNRRTISISWTNL